MKKLFAAFILCAFTSLGLSARTQNDRPVTLKGHAVTEEKAPVDYATVMLTAKADSTKVYGSITDEKGGFTVEMPKGSYRLKISFMGYDSFEREVNLAADTDLGRIDDETLVGDAGRSGRHCEHGYPRSRPFRGQCRGNSPFGGQNRQGDARALAGRLDYR